MTDKFSAPNLQEADTLLSNLFNEVHKWESTLASGTKLGVGAAAVDNLFQTQVMFGNPNNKLTLLTEETFKESGTELTSIYKQQMHDQYDFYYMTLTVDLRSKPGVQFWRLSCELDFGPKGSNEPIVQTIFPNQQWRSIMNYGVGMDIGLNGNLNWSVGIDASKLNEIINVISPNLKENVVNKNELKAFIAIPEYKYEIGSSEITALGEGNSTCYWRIQDQELQKLGTANFAVLFKVPKGTESIDLQGIAWAEPNMNWLTADVRDVFSELADRFKDLLRSKDKAASKFARGTSEKWKLTLAKKTKNK